MDIRIRYNLNAEGRKTAALAGVPAQRTQSFIASFTAADLKYATINENGDGFIGVDMLRVLDGNSYVEFDDIQTPESILAYLKEREDEIEKKYAEKKELREKVIQSFLENEKKECDYVSSDSITVTIGGTVFNIFDNENPGIKEYIDEYHRGKLMAIAEEKRKEEIKREKNKKLEGDLRDWAMVNGSELLTARIQHGQNWKQLAREEYALSRVPDGTLEIEEATEDWEIKNATLEQLRRLEELEKKYQNFPVGMRRYKYKNDDEDYERRDYFIVSVKCPDESIAEVFLDGGNE